MLKNYDLYKDEDNLFDVYIVGSVLIIVILIIYARSEYALHYARAYYYVSTRCQLSLVYDGFYCAGSWSGCSFLGS